MRSLHRPLALCVLSVLGCGGRAVTTTDSDAAATPAPPSPPPRPSEPCARGAAALSEPLKASLGDNPLDPLGYLPFAEDGCGLVRATPRGLERLALDTGARTELDPTFPAAARPSARHGVVAWEATDRNGRGIVRVKVGDGEPVTVPGDFAKAFEPRAGRDAVVFTFTNGNPSAEDADMDVAVYTPSTGKVTVVAEGPGQQRFGAIADGLVAYADFSEDPRGHFSPDRACDADVVVKDRATGAVTRRTLPGKQAFPLLDDDGTLLYVDFGAVHPEPKFHALALKIGKAREAPSDRRVHDAEKIGGATPWIQPSLRDGYVSWLEQDTRLYRRSAGLTEPQQLLARADVGFLGVASGSTAIFVASQRAGGVFVEGR